MDRWNSENAAPAIYEFSALTADQQTQLIDFLNAHFPPSVYEDHREKRRKAFENAQREKVLLEGAEQHYPELVAASEINPAGVDLSGCAIVLTAGGEGERLRQSLQSKGIDPVTLKDFTKATFPLPGFVQGFGALQINLALISHLARQHGISIPVVVTTGPEGSPTADIISQIINSFNNFGISDLSIVAQDERLHLTVDERIAWKIVGRYPRPVTHPDETGGPLMKLKSRILNGGSLIDRLASTGVNRVIVLQGTAVYHPDLIPIMARAAQGREALGVGVLRTSFPPEDQFGSFVLVEKRGALQLAIVEQKIRNESTRQLKDPTGRYFLPYNTGFYVFDISLLRDKGLPDYATPPKEVLPGTPRSPKIGYAATDILPLAKRTAVLGVDESMFGVIKNADDLDRLSALARQFGLDTLCESFRQQT